MVFGVLMYREMITNNHNKKKKNSFSDSQSVSKRKHFLVVNVSSKTMCALQGVQRLKKKKKIYIISSTGL